MKHKIEIQNLKCGGCAKTVTTSLEKIDSVSDLKIDVELSLVSFVSKNDDSLNKIETKLIEIGYPPVGMKNSVISKAKSFVSCATGKMSR